MDAVSASDAVLATRACAGDLEARAGLFERYRPALYAAAIRLLRNREDALDAVQETSVIALLRLGSLRDPAAVGGWLRAVVRSVCLMRLRRAAREAPQQEIEVASVATPEDVLEQQVLRDSLWSALEELSAEDRVTVTLRYFTRCSSYEAIAVVTGVPVGTVRSRLHRARSQLSIVLSHAAGPPPSHADLERARRAEWEHFYAELHEAPVPSTYRDVFASDVVVSDQIGRWQGVEDWSAHEQEAIALGVRAKIVGLVASPTMTIVEIDFTNPAWASDHCPPRSTFVHSLVDGRSRRLDIHYV